MKEIGIPKIKMKELYDHLCKLLENLSQTKFFIDQFNYGYSISKSDFL